MKRTSRMKRRNPVARVVKRLRPKVMRPKRGKGSYRRKHRRLPQAERQGGEAEAAARP